MKILKLEDIKVGEKFTCPNDNPPVIYQRIEDELENNPNTDILSVVCHEVTDQERTLIFLTPDTLVQLSPTDCIQPLVAKLIQDVNAQIGSGEESAIRDILTEIMHICNDMYIDFEDRLKSAKESFEEEQ